MIRTKKIFLLQNNILNPSMLFVFFFQINKITKKIVETLYEYKKKQTSEPCSAHFIRIRELLTKDLLTYNIMVRVVETLFLIQKREIDIYTKREKSI